MPEVAGDAAILSEPTDTDAMSNALTRVANDSNLRNQLISEGRSRRTLFSWDKTATLLWESMAKTYEQSV